MSCDAKIKRGSKVLVERGFFAGMTGTVTRVTGSYYMVDIYDGAGRYDCVLFPIEDCGLKILS